MASASWRTPLGGLMPHPEATLVGRFHHLTYSIFWPLIRDNGYYCRPLFLGTLCVVGDFRTLHDQTATLFIKCFNVQINQITPHYIDLLLAKAFYSSLISTIHSMCSLTLHFLIPLPLCNSL